MPALYVRSRQGFLSGVIHDPYICILLEQNNFSSVRLSKVRYQTDTHSVMNPCKYLEVIDEARSLGHFGREPEFHSIKKLALERVCAICRRVDYFRSHAESTINGLQWM